MLQVHHTTTRLSSTSESHSEISVTVCVKLPGSTVLELVEVREENTTLFKDVEHSKGSISHCDELYCSPERLKVNATSDESPYCGIANEAKHIYGIPCYPEVTHLEKGQANWSMENLTDTEINRLRALVDPDTEVIGAVSGCVDSTVTAKLTAEAIGDRIHAILADNDTAGLGINLTVIDASDEFLDELKGVTDPEKKRKTIVDTFSHVLNVKLPTSG
ncbi:GMP synthase [glutamine-hydrolyzing]; AltName: Full=Glutamine amidotransferase; AltName: Full=GMP synthetase [Cyberlindnera jadinii]|uniref:GUA1 protein n=1 Tax=Cyberlindnera jadinii (strain ATCC 18201 / CBS 1600 / BCRC 20928 / JCM 3617 / NBRC 0987 / NRRL Y-1542) TaxID=983966 RepID=A0A0H5C9I8_CYBJN|nr:GMP synthase [glutamine-hydrolyzing]; AltName: Full=Glutamine amidotransferase; AltName: Full=GMP synthetase [Cyberlindnera jadinii]